MDIHKAMRIISVMLLATLGACGGGSSGPGTSPPPPPPPPSRATQLLAYAAGDGVQANGTTELYALRDDGSSLLRVSADSVPSAAAIQSFKISPDGQWIGYISDLTGSNDALYVVPVTGGVSVQVSRSRSLAGGNVDSFAWSPDSSQLVYAGNLSDSGIFNQFASEVFLVNRDGSGDRRINGAIGNPASVEVRDPQWSPDGRYIVQEVANFSAQNGSSNAFAINIYDTTVTTPNSRRLVTSFTTIKNVRWSGDSTRLSYVADQIVQSNFNVYTIGVDGSQNTRVTDNGEFNSDSRWSPDSEMLAYLDHPTLPFPGDLVVSGARPGATDTVLVFLTVNDRQVYDFRWSPDGSQIAYTSNEATDNIRELYVINADGSGPSTRVSGPQLSTSDVFEFAWSPDGNSIAYLADQDTNTFIDLYVSRADGSSNTWISMGLNGEEVVDFAWSDDSQRLAFSTGPDGRTVTPNKLYVSQPDGSGRTEISAQMLSGPLQFSYD